MEVPLRQPTYCFVRVVEKNSLAANCHGPSEYCCAVMYACGCRKYPGCQRNRDKHCSIEGGKHDPTLATFSYPVTAFCSVFYGLFIPSNYIAANTFHLVTSFPKLVKSFRSNCMLDNQCEILGVNLISVFISSVY